MVTPEPDQVPPDGIPVKVIAVPLLQAVLLVPALTVKGAMANALEFPEFTTGELETTRIR